eukprot:CAMPEP_0116927460 /NCGR_PEP_ID=MMETSP0467-20121206/25364_1 /TAXON_ID=283647 /ORGANISM="Mesodinium pulex, Strain SPMC105" /LENGTH=51 /DNA_ID=CAMNT_0004606973 /DNA_START=1148 /DNA_END=1301 /DNA_ORIENTATION=-
MKETQELRTEVELLKMRFGDMFKVEADEGIEDTEIKLNQYNNNILTGWTDK